MQAPSANLAFRDQQFAREIARFAGVTGLMRESLPRDESRWVMMARE